MTTSNNAAYVPYADGFFHELAALSAKAREAFDKIDKVSTADVRRVLAKGTLTGEDFALLLSPAGAEELEAMARRAKEETLRHFGKARQLFAPLYLANFCTNKCIYCGFHAGQEIERRMLSPEEIEAEAKALAATGLRRVLALTGDAPKKTGAEYIAQGVAVLAKYFPSVGIEVQALTQDEYALVAAAGADSMTMFQETYDPELYARLHLSGPKRHFSFRLDAPHRAAAAGMRGVTLGALLGLGDWRFDMFMVAMHGAWLQRRFPQLELAFSMPRIRPRYETESNTDVGTDHGKNVFDPNIVSDRQFVQALTALRCFLPHAGITLSTRERAFLRDKLLDLGVTKVSAGVCTAVGGYADAAKPQETGAAESGACAKGDEKEDAVQFVIDDERSVDEMAADLERLGFQPVFADWTLPAAGDLPLAEGLKRALGERGCHERC